MADYEPKDGTLYLHPNGYKEKPSHPDYKGTAKVGGVVWEAGAWANKNKHGQTYFSVVFTPPFEPEQPDTDIPV